MQITYNPASLRRKHRVVLSHAITTIVSVCRACSKNNAQLLDSNPTGNASPYRDHNKQWFVKSMRSDIISKSGSTPQLGKHAMLTSALTKYSELIGKNRRPEFYKNPMNLQPGPNTKILATLGIISNRGVVYPRIGRHCFSSLLASEIAYLAESVNQ